MKAGAIHRCIFTAVLLYSAAATAGRVTVEPDGGLTVEGARWFPIGTYEIPKDATRYKEFVDTGFNLIRADMTRESLDQCQQHRMFAWIPIGGLAQVRDETSANQLKAKVEELKDHPALAIWELPDEALWNVWNIPYEQFNAEKRDILNRITTGQWDTVHGESLRKQYTELIAADSIRDLDQMDRVLAELWQSLNEPAKAGALKLAGVPNRAADLLSELLGGYRLIHASDPAHPVWQNHAPRNTADLLAGHAAYCDLIGCDIYPYSEHIPQGHSDLASQALSSVGDYTRRFREVAPDKGTLMVLQAFAWKQIQNLDDCLVEAGRGQPPTYRASRFMAYNSIVNGAHGLCYWGSDFDSDRSTWKNLKPVIREIASIQGFLAQPATPIPVDIKPMASWSSLDRPVRMTARRLGDDWLFIFVNESKDPQTVHVDFPLAFQGKKLYFLYENLFVEPAGGSYVPLSFSGYGVRLISTRQGLEVPELEGLNRLFENPF